MEDSRFANKTLTIGGPQHLAFDEVIDVYERMIGSKSSRRYVSAAQLRLMGMLYGLLDETKARLFRMRYELATSNWQVVSQKPCFAAVFDDRSSDHYLDYQSLICCFAACLSLNNLNETIELAGKGAIKTIAVILPANN